MDISNNSLTTPDEISQALAAEHEAREAYRAAKSTYRDLCRVHPRKGVEQAKENVLAAFRAHTQARSALKALQTKNTDRLWYHDV